MVWRNELVSQFSSAVNEIKVLACTWVTLGLINLRPGYHGNAFEMILAPSPSFCLSGPFERRWAPDTATILRSDSNHMMVPETLSLLGRVMRSDSTLQHPHPQLMWLPDNPPARTTVTSTPARWALSHREEFPPTRSWAEPHCCWWRFTAVYRHKDRKGLMFERRPDCRGKEAEASSRWMR